MPGKGEEELEGKLLRILMHSSYSLDLFKKKAHGRIFGNVFFSIGYNLENAIICILHTKKN